jgi:RNA polymerase sigma-70 factor, ECF subfamily
VGTATLNMMMTSESPEQQSDWVALAKQGDTAAFEKLYRANSGRVYALCLRMTRDAAMAEDLTQEAFVRAWQKLNQFRGDSAFSTWMHRLTSNLVLTALRSQTRRTDRVFTTDDLSAFEKAGRERVGGIRVDLEQAIAALPEKARKVFILYEVEGYKHHEIADMMGIASGTTKAQLHRARRMLREALA